MHDKNLEEWTKLVQIEHIDQATRHIKRLSLGLQLLYSRDRVYFADAKPPDASRPGLAVKSGSGLNRGLNLKYVPKT